MAQMKYLATLFSSILLVGCGPDWSGKFVGTISQMGKCNDGSSVPTSNSAISMTLQDDGDTVTWEASCGATAIADLDDDIANVRQYSCPAQTQPDGTTMAVTVTDGKLMLDDDVMHVDFDMFFSLSGTTTGTCDVVVEGSLDRLSE